MDPKIYYTFVVSFFLGIFTRSFFEIFLAELLFISLLLVTIFIIFHFFKQKIPSYFLFALVLFFAFSLGATRLAIFQQYNIGDFNQYVGQKIEQKIVVADEPEKKGYHTKLILQLENSDSKAIM